MAKVFISHSSKDKDFVSKVVELIGIDHCIYDQYEFEIGMKNIDEIFRGLEKTDIFVYFISEYSLESRWVKEELNHAKEKLGLNASKLKQIFPIIIDNNITYDDSRIMPFLKEGFNSYNLRHIKTPQIAARKIKSQMVAMIMEDDLEYKKKKNFFYGRQEEIALFQKRFDDLLKEPLQCLFVSGINGIGRKSFVRAALKHIEIIEPYYFPMSISLNRTENIDDLILKLSDLGLGKYTLTDITKITSQDYKIEILTELINEAQEYKEQIIIEDDFCLVSMDGNIKYWFINAIQKAKNNLNISIITRVKLDSYRYQHQNNFFFVNLKELDSSDCIGFLRALSRSEQIEFTREDLEFLKNCLSGYPPQIQYCVELAKENDIEFVKNNSYLVDQLPEQISSEILLLAIDKNEEVKYKSLLALLADFENTPVSLLSTLIKGDEVYREALRSFKALSICYNVGASNEYIKINSFLQNYIQRNRYELSFDMKELLANKVKEFEVKCGDESYTDTLGIVELSYFIKQNLKEEKSIPEKFLYSTVFLQSIIELYNHKKSEQVIKIVNAIEEKIQSYDEEVKDRIMYYYCLALARKRSSDFEIKVEYFNNSDNRNTYLFLKGFECRLIGKFKRAKEYYEEILRNNKSHIIARRELVTILISMSEYEAAFELAKANYKNNKNNSYFIQAYFETLVYRKNRSEEDNKAIEEIVSIVKKLCRDSKENKIYYQILAKHSAFIENNKDKAVEFISKGMNDGGQNNITYLLKDLFDIYEHFNDVQNMEKAYHDLEKEVTDNEVGDSRMAVVLAMREAILSAYKGESKFSIEIKIHDNRALLSSSKENIINKIDRILQKRY